MKIVEKDFILEPVNFYLFDLFFIKKVKNSETGELELKKIPSARGCSLGHALSLISRNRVHTKYESESLYLAELLQKLTEADEKLLALCKESLPEKFDTGD